MRTIHYLSLAIFLVAGIIIGFVGGVQAMKSAGCAQPSCPIVSK